MAADGNGNLRLTWGQITWLFALLVAVVSSWANLRFGQMSMDQHLTRIDGSIANVYTKSEIDRMMHDATLERQELRRRINRLERRAGISEDD